MQLGGIEIPAEWQLRTIAVDGSPQSLINRIALLVTDLGQIIQKRDGEWEVMCTGTN